MTTALPDAHSVAETPVRLAAPVVVGARERRRPAPRWWVWLRAGLPLVVGALVAVAVAVPRPLAAAVLLAAAAPGMALPVQAGWADHLRRCARRAVTGAALLAAVVVLTPWGEPDLVRAGAAGLAVLGTRLPLTVLERRRLGRLRAVLVMDRRAVDDASLHWTDRGPVQVVGALVVDDEGRADTSPHSWPVPRATGTRDVARLVRDAGADAVLALPSPVVGARLLEELAWQLENTRARLLVAPGVQGAAAHRLGTAAVGSEVCTVLGPSRPSAATRVAKAVLDRVGAAVLLLLLGPALLALMLLVRLDSPGPAIFRQERVGRAGRPFRMYKLRTMVVDAERRKRELAAADEGNGVLFKIHDDPRVTRVGRILRSSSLDELPQLVNVLRGEMSLVGPRPALAEEVARYDARALRRLAVRPGLTGLWQVRGRSTLDWEQSVTLDLRYTDNVTVLRDLGICLETVRAVLARRGAY